MGSKPQFLQLAVTAASVGGSLLWNAIKNHKRIRHVADTPRSKVASAPQGFVEIEGFAWPKGETVLTLDNEEAIYYVLELQQEESSGSGKNRRKNWVTVFKHEHVLPFYLLDPTGVAVVVPHNPEINMTNTSEKKYARLGTEAKNRIAELVNGTIEHFPPATGFFKIVVRNYRVLEKKLVVGSPFYASGDFKTESFNQLTIDDSLATFANKVINFESRSLKNVNKLLDRNADGRVSAEEAIAGYTTAAKLSRLNPQNQTAPLEVFGEIGCSANHQLFFADTHEQHLIEKLRTWHTLKLTSGAAIVAASICLVLLEFGLLVNPFEAAKAAERQRIAREEQAQVEAQKQITILHEACVGGRAGFCRQLLDRKAELQLTDQHLKYYQDAGCRFGEASLCRHPATSR